MVEDFFFWRTGRWVIYFVLPQNLYFIPVFPSEIDYIKKQMKYVKKISSNVHLQVINVRLAEDNCPVSVSGLYLSGHKQIINVCFE